jgi:hypothetical protein
MHHHLLLLLLPLLLLVAASITAPCVAPDRLLLLPLLLACPSHGLHGTCMLRM